MKKYALIVAGGIGSRMQSDVPKQFLPLCGRPVLFHTLEKFFAADEATEIILTLPKHYLSYWKDVCRKNKFKLKHKVIEGGETRFHSVQKGLNVIREDGIVAVHDAVRPLISAELINRLYTEAEQFGNAVPSVPVNESMRSVAGERNFFADRSMYRLIQTPQCFNTAVIKKAFLQSYSITFTDEANVAEADGVFIHLVNGEAHNLKITTADDLVMVEALMSK